MKIVDIAKEAGVSIGTVDRVLHGRGRVSKETREKIEKIIKENNYHPNQMARNLKMGKTLKIGILIPFLKSEGGYWEVIMSGMQTALQELSSLSVSAKIMQFSRYKKGDMIVKGLELLKHGVDVIAMPPVVRSESYDFLAKLKNIPYAFFDSPLAKTQPITENLQDPYQAGLCGARLMELFQHEKGNFLCIQMHDAAYNLQRRAQGFIDYFLDKDVSVINAQGNENSQENFYFFIDTLMQKYPNTNGIFVTNDMTGKIAKYVAEKNYIKKPIIIGFDLIDINAEQLAQGNIAALISQQPRQQGYNTIQEIFRILLLEQKNTTSTSKIPIEIIIKENLIT